MKKLNSKNKKIDMIKIEDLVEKLLNLNLKKNEFCSEIFKFTVCIFNCFFILFWFQLREQDDVTDGLRIG